MNYELNDEMLKGINGGVGGDLDDPDSKSPKSMPKYSCKDCHHQFRKLYNGGCPNCGSKNYTSW